MPSRHPHRNGTLEYGSIHAVQASDRGPNDGQHRIQRQRNECRARTNAPNQRQRDEKSKERKAGNGLGEIREADERARERRTPRGKNAERDTNSHGNRRGHDDKHNVLTETCGQLAAM